VGDHPGALVGRAADGGDVRDVTRVTIQRSETVGRLTAPRLPRRVAREWTFPCVIGGMVLHHHRLHQEGLMRRLIPLLALAFVAATACNNDSTGPNGSIVGNYQLRTINGSQLPYQVSFNKVIQSEQLTLNSDGSYSDVADFSDGTNFVEQGYYSQNNNLLTFNDQTDGITYQGSISGNVLTESTNGYTAVYQKN
jgi:hypothetical protein